MRFYTVRELTRAANAMGWEVRKVLDPSQGYNMGWQLYFDGQPDGEFSFKLEGPNEELCKLGRGILDTEVASYEAEARESARYGLL